MAFVPPLVISSKIGSKLLGGLFAAQRGTAAAKKESIELFGYDFPGLLLKLLVYFTAALAIAKYMEAVIAVGGLGGGFIKILAGLFGWQLQNPFPPELVSLFKEGYGEQKIKFWDIIKAIAIVLVAYEGYHYFQVNKVNGGRADPFTLLVFGALGSFLGLITFPELLAKMKGKNITLSSSSGAVGSSFTVTVIGLKADTPATYGWKDAGGVTIFSREIAVGAIFGVSQPFTFDETVLSTTAAGTYTIFFDQRAGGGPYYEARFTVLEGIAQ